jgi:DNA-binding CsgD family transcriptional regulator
LWIEPRRSFAPEGFAWQPAEHPVRGREVVALLMDGMTSSRDLAERLVVSEHTINYHIKAVMRKLGVCSRAQIIAYAYQARPRLETSHVGPT